MRFTQYQYDKAIEALQDARQQLEPDGHCCACCGDSGHQAFECGFNPLVAMSICEAIRKDANQYHGRLHSESPPRVFEQVRKLHEICHYLAGYETCMGELIGPAKVKLPFETPEEEAAALRGVRGGQQG